MSLFFNNHPSFAHRAQDLYSRTITGIFTFSFLLISLGLCAAIVLSIASSAPLLYPILPFLMLPVFGVLGAGVTIGVIAGLIHMSVSAAIAVCTLGAMLVSYFSEQHPCVGECSPTQSRLIYRERYPQVFVAREQASATRIYFQDTVYVQVPEPTNYIEDEPETLYTRQANAQNWESPAWKNYVGCSVNSEWWNGSPHSP